jgi:hypothetical protein
MIIMPVITWRVINDDLAEIERSLLPLGLYDIAHYTLYPTPAPIPTALSSSSA